MYANIFFKISRNFQLPSFGSQAFLLILNPSTMYPLHLSLMGPGELGKCKIPGNLGVSFFRSRPIFWHWVSVMMYPSTPSNGLWLGGGLTLTLTDSLSQGILFSYTLHSCAILLHCSTVPLLTESTVLPPLFPFLPLRLPPSLSPFIHCGPPFPFSLWWVPPCPIQPLTNTPWCLISHKISEQSLPVGSPCLCSIKLWLELLN